MALGKGETMSRRLLSVGLAVLTIGAGGTGMATAAGPRPGNVDPAFGVDGTVVQPRSLLPSAGFAGPFGEDMAVGPEGGLFVLQSERECRWDSATCRIRHFVQRYRSDGSVEESFGSQGKSAAVEVNSPVASSTLPFADPLASIAATPTDESIVASVDVGRLVLFRFGPSGQLSTGFGSEGRAATGLGGVVGQPRLAVLAEGRILVAVDAPAQDGSSVIVLARFMADGSPDPSFGAGLPEATGPGVIAIPAQSAADLAVSPGGPLVLGGTRCCPGSRSVFFGRRDAAGGPLGPFSSARPWRHLQVGRNAYLRSVLALPGGRIALVGSSNRGTFVARLLPSGRRDRHFGKAGIVYLKRLQLGFSPALSDSAGNIYVAGHRSSGEEYVPNRGLIARMTRRGRIDRRWGSAPPGYSLLPDSISEPIAMGFQSQGKLVVFGIYGGDCIRTCALPGRVLTRLYASRRQGR